MDFQETLNYLYGLGNEVSAMKLGLENIGKLLAALNNPEKNYLKIQVAGTNGKGSTCAFLEAICVSAGIKTGLTTSPHLVSITERVKIDGREISEESFAARATEIRETSEKLVSEQKLETVPTFFEQITAIALSAFREAKVEIAILETGLGGRFDATTAAKAEIVALTPIDFDHQNILGNSLAEIAAEKAAIVREDTKVISAQQPKEAQKIIRDVCTNIGVKPKLVQTITTNENAGLISFQTENAEYRNVKLNLLGKHQIENAKVAVLLAETLQENGFKITTENIVEGLQTAKHKGRLEFWKNFLFDGAHNVAGATALREFLDEFVKQPVTLVFGVMKDKDLSEIMAILFPKAEFLILTKPDNPRSAETCDLINLLPGDFAHEKVFLAETVEEALKIARKISADKNLICVTGSLYLVGEAQKQLSVVN